MCEGPERSTSSRNCKALGKGPPKLKKQMPRLNGGGNDSQWCPISGPAAYDVRWLIIGDQPNLVSCQSLTHHPPTDWPHPHHQDHPCRDIRLLDVVPTKP